MICKNQQENFNLCPLLKIEVTYTAVRGVLDPPEPAPSMLNMWPPLAWFLITRMASRVQSREPTMFVETIYHETKRYSTNQFVL